MPLVRFVLAAAVWIGLSLVSVVHAALVTEIPPRNTLAGVERHALVIGNSRYANVTPLANPANDAAAMAKALSNVGFHVYQAVDLDRAAMTNVIGQFLNAVTPGSETVVYYAGHGVELNGQNYLLPIDINKLDPSQQYALRSNGISLTELLQDLEARKPRVSVIILDACRNNPFEGAGTRSLGSERGLSRIDPPQGSLVLYAAAAGETALDDLGPNDAEANGLFTRNLLKLIEQPGLEVRDMVQQLKDSVYEAALNEAQHTQRPSYYDGLIGKFYFMPATVENPGPASTPITAGTDPCEVIVTGSLSTAELLLADSEEGVSACTVAVARDPKSKLFRQLLELAKEQRSAQKALLSDNPTLSRSYLDVYPKSTYVGDVREHLADLEAPDVAPVAPEPDVATPPPEQPVPVAVEVDPAELARDLQVELNRVGCGTGTPDGIWGKKSQQALQAFSQKRGLSFATLEPSAAILDQVRAITDRVCQLSCAVTQVEKNGVCVTKSCPKGQNLSSRGVCYTPVKRSDNGGGGGSAPSNGGCFVFNGQDYCQ